MNTTETPSRARFRPGDRFDSAPEPAAPFTRTAESELEQLKNRLLRAVLERVANPALLAPLRRAANAELTHVSGEQVEAHVKETFSASPRVVELLKELLKSS